MPPVGKSGPLIDSMIWSIDSFGFSRSLNEPLITSVRLCGGTFVAIPTAIPDDPLIKRFGILVGITSGICSEPS